MTLTEYAPIIAIGLQTIILLVGGGVMVLRTSSDNRELREDIKAMQDELKELAEVVTTQAVPGERLNEHSRRMTMLEQRIEDMRRGKGYVQDRDANKAIDREY